MPVTTVNRTKTIIKTINQNIQSSETVILYENTAVNIGTELVPGHKVISFNSFVKNLRAFARVHNLQPAQLPNIELSDSETDKLKKVLNAQWTSPRMHLELFISNAENGSDNWSPVGSISLLNPQGYSYKLYNLMNLYTNNLAIELGVDGKLGARVIDVGYGYLNGSESVVIHGSCVEEIFLEYEEKPTNINITVTGGGNNSSVDYSISDSSEINNNSEFGNN